MGKELEKAEIRVCVTEPLCAHLKLTRVANPLHSREILKGE